MTLKRLICDIFAPFLHPFSALFSPEMVRSFRRSCQCAASDDEMDGNPITKPITVTDAWGGCKRQCRKSCIACLEKETYLKGMILSRENNGTRSFCTQSYGTIALG
jgi:hypothetical protein